ncbi:MAG: hypothetical protein J0M04_21355 [Verrucomicrobia bacterium]|nr:hypothetical protein [Verrucomicrobiota bacterium]
MHTRDQEWVFDVLAILASRAANIILGPAATWHAARPPSDACLFSRPYGKPSRPSKESCAVRNRFVLTRAAARFIPHVAPGGSLADDMAEVPESPIHPPISR